MKQSKSMLRACLLPFIVCSVMGSGTTFAGGLDFDETGATLGQDSVVSFNNQLLSSDYCDDGDCERSYIVTVALDGQKSIVEMLLTLLNENSPDVRVEYELASGNDIELYDAKANEMLTLSYVQTADHTLDIRVEGSQGTNYNLKVSTLSTAPLPATAWLLLSAMGGAAWLRGRRRRSGAYPTT